MKHTKQSLLLIVAVITFGSLVGRTGADDFVDTVKRDTEALCETPSRLLGSAGHERAKEMLAERITALDGVTLVRQSFQLITPTTKKAVMTIDNGEFKGEHRIYPVWPDVARLKTTPETGLAGKAIYIGDGSYKSMPAKSLRGNIAAFEMSAYSTGNWLRAFEYGAKAVLLLGSKDDSAFSPYIRSIYKPRYYIPDGPLADALRQGSIDNVVLQCDMAWEDKTAENLMALVPGTDPSLRPIIILGKYDAMSLIPGLAPGADDAVDAAFLLRLLTHFSEYPPKRGVMIAFIDAFNFNFLGIRHLSAMLTASPQDPTRQVYEEHIQDRIDEYQELVTQVEKLGPDPQKALPQLADKNKYLILQRYVKDLMSPEILSVREEIIELRLAEHEAEGEKKKTLRNRLEQKLDRKTDLNSIMAGIIAKGELPEEHLDECAEIWQKIRNRCFKQLEGLKQQSTLFAKYDAIRKKVLNAMNMHDAPAVPFPFMLGIDLSDCSTNLGTPLYCAALYNSYPRSARQFTNWLKAILKDSGNPYAKVPEDRLQALGLRADGFKGLFDRILNEESVAATGVEEMMAEAIPGITKSEIARVLTAIRKEKALGSPNLEEIAFQILLREVPDLAVSQAVLLAHDIINKESISGRVDSSTLSVQRLPLLTSVSKSFQMTGATWSALEGIRWRLDTPQDTADRLNWDRLEPQIRLTSLMIELLVNDPDFAPDDNQAREGTFPRWHILDGVVVSETVAETIARTPRPGMLITTFNDNPKKDPDPHGFRGLEFVRSGLDGRYRFNSVPADCYWQARNRFLKAYSVDKNGKITRAIAEITSMLTTHSIGRYTMAHKPPIAPLRGDTFECVEINGPDFWDPRYQKPITSTQLIDVKRGGPPKKHYWPKGGDIPMFGLVPLDTQYQILATLGGGKNRMVLLNVPEDLNRTGKPLRVALKSGFDSDEALPAIPELISARDFYHIDEWRLRRLEGAGVVCKAIRGIHSETKTWLDKAEEAYEADDGDGYKRASAAALANEIRVYQAAQDQANDVTRGAIFLLLLLVPFSIAMERLLFASPQIGKQITKSMIIFVLMFVALASFHPGFRITTMPAVILIAFMVLLLSVTVINMIMRKFRADMEELRRGTLAEASGAQTGRGGVIVSAIWLGIANMRKRMVRTILTGLTIVLVTFSLLCFTSSSTYQEKRTTTLQDIEVAHDGVLLQHPASQELEIGIEENVATLLGDDQTLVGRYWATGTAGTPDWRIHIRNPKTNQLAAIKSGLGLRPAEDQFSNIREVLVDWDQFANGTGCYISEVNARKLGVQAGDEVVVAGVPLKLISTFDAREFEDKVRKLDGQSLLPLDYTIQNTDGAMADQETMEAEMSSGKIAEPNPDMIFVSADQVIVLPVYLTKKLQGTVRSLAVRSDKEETASLANRLVQLIVYPIYYGAADGVKVIVSTPLIPKAPRKLFIPILIAVLIIFNTMLNSIAERKKEIYIYSSLGLAPRHIGILFLAEALTYGIMGSVFGYVIGQGVAKILTEADLMGGVTLNYSGSNVILTMGLVLAVVILSALVPAYMAAKVASPSGDLDWKVPQPKDGVIRGQLPFTVSKQAAPGLAAFLQEFMKAHIDGAIGNFTSDNIRLEPGEGNTVISLKSTIWPAPYDLGVRQDMTIDFELSESDICDLHVRLDHGAGPERSWWRLNRVFLGVIRSQLLGWRNIAPERMLKYIRQAPINIDAAPPQDLGPNKPRT